ncbi:MAG: type II toxin-antitoxin system RelE/ParE family toxin [Bacteroidota bacterium]|nr:type II toxin-antitoxin system RelE/ParE family toxin [Bacteroidota bacterium]MDQ6904521.1 type II toxin-antitoxin system RelE/ParE family toxin [Bacteroidota bacterium]
MEVIVTKKFVKELKPLPKPIQLAVKFVLIKLTQAKSLQDSGFDFTKMEGAKKDEKYYRIRVGDYRIGLENKTPKIIIITIIHRSAVYKKFPPRN